MRLAQTGRSVLSAVCALGLATSLDAQRPQFPSAPDPAREAIELLPVQGLVSMIGGAGANITVLAGDDGI